MLRKYAVHSEWDSFVPQVRQESSGWWKVTLFAAIVYALYFIPSIPTAYAARVLLNPAAGSVTVGSTFVTDVVVQTEGELVNAVSVQLSYPRAALNLRATQAVGSAFPLAPQPPQADGVRGSVSFQAGAPGGFQGQAEVLRLTWEARQSGTVVLQFAPGTQLLRHSAEADAVPTTLVPGSFTVVERDASLPAITSKDHPDEAKWYSGPFIRLAWELQPGARYSYLLSSLPGDEPDEAPDEPAGEIKLTTPQDGVFYFHLRECRGTTCGPTARRMVMKDTTPPEPFTPLLGYAPGAFEGRRFVSFVTTDAASGIDRYEVAEGGAEWQAAASPWVLRDQAGATQLTVRAYDRAGNWREVSLDVPASEAAPWQRRGAVALGLAGVLALWWMHRRCIGSGGTTHDRA